MNHKNLAEYLNGLPQSNPTLAPLLLYTNRSNIRSFLKKHNKITMLIPSNNMMAELRSDFEHKRFRDLDLKVMSLFLVGDYNNAESFKKNSTINNMSHQLSKEYIGKSKVKLSNGSTASHIKSHGFDCWQLHGDHMPKTAKLKKGGFENPTSLLSEENHKSENPQYLKAIELIKKTLKKEDGFKRAVCDLYNCLSETEKDIVRPFICGSPIAEFFLMYDSTVCNPDLSKFETETVEDWNTCYNNLCSHKGEYVLDSGNEEDINTLKVYIDSGPEDLENKLKNLFTGMNGGEFEIDGNMLKICPAPMSEYLMSYAIFRHHMAKIHDSYLSASESEKEKLLLDAIIYNNSSNIKNADLNYFKYLKDDEVEDIEKGVKLFNTFIVPMIKTNVRTTTEGAKEIKVKNRKTSNIKKKISKLSQEQKKKLLQFLSKN